MKTFLSFVVVLGSFAVLAQDHSHMSHDMGGASMVALEQAKGKNFDIYWMSQMIEHHRGATAMAKDVLKNGTDPRVKKAAQSIISAQTKEIKQLTTWLKTWYNTTPNINQMALMRKDMEPMMLASHGGMAGMVMGNPDKNFLNGMIPHHQGAVDMSQMALTKALKPELKTFAKAVIKAQTAEINQYKVWLKTIK